VSRLDPRPAALGAHVTADELSRFVLDALAPAAQRRLERHLSTCDSCARALAAEAAAEQTLVELWPEVRRPLAPVLPLRPSPAPLAVPPRRRSLLAGGMANALAAAVIAAVFVGYWTDGRSPGADGGRAGDALAALTGHSDEGGGLLCRLPTAGERPLSRVGDGPGAMCALADSPPGGELCQEEPAVRSCLVR
jgi:hypothetical protein